VSIVREAYYCCRDGCTNRSAEEAMTPIGNRFVVICPACWNEFAAWQNGRVMSCQEWCQALVYFYNHIPIQRDRMNADEFRSRLRSGEKLPVSDVSMMCQRITDAIETDKEL